MQLVYISFHYQYPPSDNVYLRHSNNTLSSTFIIIVLTLFSLSYLTSVKLFLRLSVLHYVLLMVATLWNATPAFTLGHFPLQRHCLRLFFA